jgi:hypothetical protein
VCAEAGDARRIIDTEAKKVRNWLKKKMFQPRARHFAGPPAVTAEPRMPAFKG